MALTNYRVEIADHDYHHTVYTTWVQAFSKNQAIAMGAAMAGAEKSAREFKLNHRTPFGQDGALVHPDVRLVPVALDEYFDHEYEIKVTHD